MPNDAFQVAEIMSRITGAAQARIGDNLNRAIDRNIERQERQKELDYKERSLNLREKQFEYGIQHDAYTEKYRYDSDNLKFQREQQKASIDAFQENLDLYKKKKRDLEFERERMRAMGKDFSAINEKIDSLDSAISQAEDNLIKTREAVVSGDKDLTQRNAPFSGNLPDLNDRLVLPGTMTTDNLGLQSGGTFLEDQLSSNRTGTVTVFGGKDDPQDDGTTFLGETPPEDAAYSSINFNELKAIGVPFNKDGVPDWKSDDQKQFIADNYVREVKLPDGSTKQFPILDIGPELGRDAIDYSVGALAELGREPIYENGQIVAVNDSSPIESKIVRITKTGSQVEPLNENSNTTLFPYGSAREAEEVANAEFGFDENLTSQESPPQEQKFYGPEGEVSEQEKEPILIDIPEGRTSTIARDTDSPRAPRHTYRSTDWDFVYTGEVPRNGPITRVDVDGNIVESGGNSFFEPNETGDLESVVLDDDYLERGLTATPVDNGDSLILDDNNPSGDVKPTASPAPYAISRDYIINTLSSPSFASWEEDQQRQLVSIMKEQVEKTNPDIFNDEIKGIIDNTIRAGESREGFKQQLPGYIKEIIGEQKPMQMFIEADANYKRINTLKDEIKEQDEEVLSLIKEKATAKSINSVEYLAAVEASLEEAIERKNNLREEYNTLKFGEDVEKEVIPNPEIQDEPEVDDELVSAVMDDPEKRANNVVNNFPGFLKDSLSDRFKISPDKLDFSILDDEKGVIGNFIESLGGDKNTNRVVRATQNAYIGSRAASFNSSTQKRKATLYKSAMNYIKDNKAEFEKFVLNETGVPRNVDYMAIDDGQRQNKSNIETVMKDPALVYAYAKAMIENVDEKTKEAIKDARSSYQEAVKDRYTSVLDIPEDL